MKETIRLGLIADTHVPTHLPLLPYDAIEHAFRNVDAILHAGNITSATVLGNLSGIAPTQAVRGTTDTLDLPEKRVLTFGNTRVGLIHGNRHPLIERYYRLQRKLGNPYAGGRDLLNSLPRHFAEDEVDVIVFGYLHMPITLRRDNTVIVNPGAVYTISEATAQWQLLHERDEERRAMLETHIRRYRHFSRWQHPPSTVGILEIATDTPPKVTIQPLPILAYA
ncbi:MAG: metallophosphoesterase family protein [Chloroflexota bacterium]